MPLENGEYKMAVIIRKQKRATERNRMRRLIKEAYRLLLPRFRRGHHIVVMPLPSAIERLKKAKMQEVKEEMERILHKSGIL
jgi:ribonuclease P protein component